MVAGAEVDVVAVPLAVVDERIRLAGALSARRADKPAVVVRRAQRDADDAPAAPGLPEVVECQAVLLRLRDGNRACEDVAARGQLREAEDVVVGADRVGDDDAARATVAPAGPLGREAALE